MSEDFYDVLCVGELVIDLISMEPAPSLREACTFRRFLGGAPANVAQNVAALGGISALVAAVGLDELGEWAQETLKQAGVVTEHLIALPQPTSLVLVTRHTTTPHFLVYRGADRYLSPDCVTLDVVRRTRAVHTSAFALAQPPLRDLVLGVMHAARQTNCLVSIDPNFHPGLWSSFQEAYALLAEATSLAQIVKPSLDDCQRLFGTRDAGACAQRFLAWGAEHVCITQGPYGSRWFSKAGESRSIPAHDVPVMDVTGAGDAFLAGLLMAWLDGLSPYDAGRVAQYVAELKLQHLGSLASPIHRGIIYRAVMEQRR